MIFCKREIAWWKWFFSSSPVFEKRQMWEWKAPCSFKCRLKVLQLCFNSNRPENVLTQNQYWKHVHGHIAGQKTVTLTESSWYFLLHFLKCVLLNWNIFWVDIPLHLVLLGLTQNDWGGWTASLKWLKLKWFITLLLISWYYFVKDAFVNQWVKFFLMQRDRQKLAMSVSSHQ